MNRIAFLIAKVTPDNVFTHNVGYGRNFINCIALTCLLTVSLVWINLLGKENSLARANYSF